LKKYGAWQSRIPAIYFRTADCHLRYAAHQPGQLQPSPIDTQKAAEAFNATPHLALLDGNATPIPVKLDILEISANGKIIDYERETEHYNKAGKYASLPKFATMMADDSTLLSGVSELDTPQTQSQTSQNSA
jgi:uncharacterized protein YccT (UPF0319 family)